MTRFYFVHLPIVDGRHSCLGCALAAPEVDRLEKILRDRADLQPIEVLRIDAARACWHLKHPPQSWPTFMIQRDGEALRSVIGPCSAEQLLVWIEVTGASWDGAASESMIISAPRPRRQR